MDREALARRVLELVTEIAPDVDAAGVLPGVRFRDQFDFDSMDTLNLAIALHREFGVDVPEAEYSHLSSVDQCVDYLAGRVPDATTAGT